MPTASDNIQPNGNQHAHHGKHEVKDPQQIHECAKIPIKIRQALMIQIWSHQRIMDKNQGSSKEIGYQLKGDLSHMYRFLSRQIVDDLHLQRNLHI